MKRWISLLIGILLLAYCALAHQPVIVGQEVVKIEKPEISRAFYDELKGKPRSYLIDSEKEFSLYVNLLVPKNSNPKGRYSAHIYSIINSQRIILAEVEAFSVEWNEFYEPFGGDTYLKGPEFKKVVPAGNYEIVVYSRDNLGKYVLAVGESEFFGPKEILQIYTEVPKLKKDFFNTNPLTFLATPFGIAAVLIVGGIIYLIFRKR